MTRHFMKNMGEKTVSKLLLIYQKLWPMKIKVFSNTDMKFCHIISFQTLVDLNILVLMKLLIKHEYIPEDFNGVAGHLKTLKS